MLFDPFGRKRRQIEQDPFLRAVAEAATVCREHFSVLRGDVEMQAQSMAAGLMDDPRITDEIRKGASTDYIHHLSGQIAAEWGERAGQQLAHDMGDPIGRFLVRQRQAREAGHSERWLTLAAKCAVHPDPAHPLPAIDKRLLAEQAFRDQWLDGEAQVRLRGEKLDEPRSREIYELAVSRSGHDPGWLPRDHGEAEHEL